MCDDDHMGALLAAIKTTWMLPLKNDDPGIRFVRGTGLGLSKAVVEVSYQLAHHSIG